MERTSVRGKLNRGCTMSGEMKREYIYKEGAQWQEIGDQGTIRCKRIGEDAHEDGK